MVVQKYGGTSLGSSERIIKVAQIIADTYKEETVLAVVSAMSSYVKSEGTTSQLLEAADKAIKRQDFQPNLNYIKELHLKTVENSIKNESIKENVFQFVNGIINKLIQFLDAITIIRELSPLSNDRIIRVGEKLSAFILAGILSDQNLPAVYVDLSDIISREGYNAANPQFYNQLESNLLEKLQPLVSENKIPIITGFIGEVPGGIIESIGRGYTDYTSSMVSAILNAKELQIWKEVDGIFTADPRLVKDAQVLPTISPQEAAELTYFGSEVIHPFTMERVTRAGIPVRIKNTFAPDLAGTLITDQETDKRVVKAITAKKNVTVLNIYSNRMLMAYGFMAKVFYIFEKYGVIIDLISTSEVSISLSVEKCSRLRELTEELSNLGSITTEEGSILSMVGQNMKSTVGIAGKMFSTLSENKINIEMISQGASEINISCVIKNEDADKAVQVLHERFITSA